MADYALLIFDWDGTLSDSAAHIVTAVQAAISAMQLPPRSDESIRELIGLGVIDAMLRLFPELDGARAMQLLNAYRQKIPVEYIREPPLFDGALETLQQLKADGYALAVATGKSRPGMRRTFQEHAGAAPLFVASRCADETASKPDPLMLREILDETGFTAAQALMIGDTEFDVAMARSLGMQALGVATGVHEPGRLLTAGAAAVVEDVRAVPAWLKKQD
jgi:phosphoglycolate phosphatase